ncbi:PREDICTED: ras-related protein RGP2-like [Acropora digitifera]|uniref:ras-related protein RGP2-like n=1 Tax=Acropora digitifera TaxID=70779 RepID=UPI00077B0500|nr:PREDICTED: ras-related protein RGP2-like [Acropora digitifera]
MGAAGSCGGGKIVKQEIPTFKVVLVGDPEVGKTSIFLRYTKNQFDYSYQPSVSVSIGNVVKHVNIPYETIVSLALWDLPGREEMDLRRSYYKDVDAAIGKCLQLVNLITRLMLKLFYFPSVTVSAKESDNSVHAAIQSLIRHLLQQKMKDARHSLKGGMFSKNEVIDEKNYVTISPLEVSEKREFIPLIVTKVPEFDVLFSECNTPIETVQNTSTGLLDAMNNFKRACSRAGVTGSAKASLEECIDGIKQLIRTADDEDGLEAHEDGGYIKLIVKEECKDSVPGPVQRVLKSFHTELGAASKKVLTQAPGALNKLREHEEKINELKITAFDRAVAKGMSQRRAKAAVINIDANCTRIGEALATAMETMTAVDNDYKRIKAAMLW